MYRKGFFDNFFVDMRVVLYVYVDCCEHNNSLLHHKTKVYCSKQFLFRFNTADTSL